MKLKKIFFKNLIFNPHTTFAYNLIFLYILTLKYMFSFVFNAVFCTRRLSVPVTYVRTTLLMVSILWGVAGLRGPPSFFFFFYLVFYLNFVLVSRDQLSHKLSGKFWEIA